MKEFTRSIAWRVLLLGVATATSACHQSKAADTAAKAADPGVDTQGTPTKPPFAVKADCKGLLLVWFDDKGVHTADKRDGVPKAHRAKVRVESLRIPPDKRLDPEWVYVADLRKAGKDGQYPVSKMRRTAFDALVDAAGAPKNATASAGDKGSANNGDSGVIVYGASWCEACKEADEFFQNHGVPFVEKDIEKDADALAEMQRKAKKAGIQPTGIPIIDYKGTIVQGFNADELTQLMASNAKPI